MGTLEVDQHAPSAPEIALSCYDEILQCAKDTPSFGQDHPGSTSFDTKTPEHSMPGANSRGTPFYSVFTAKDMKFTCKAPMLDENKTNTQT